MSTREEITKALEEAKREVSKNRNLKQILYEDEVEIQTPEEAPINSSEVEAANDTTPIEAEGEDAENTELFVPTPNTLAEIDIYKFIDILNKFRSSPSFNEGVVRDEFDKYWESLQPVTRQLVYVTILGFTEIALKGKDANRSTHPNNFELRGSSGSEQSVVPAEGAEPADKAEETLGDQQFTPIVVGESHQVFSRKENIKKDLIKKLFS